MELLGCVHELKPLWEWFSRWSISIQEWYSERKAEEELEQLHFSSGVERNLNSCNNRMFNFHLFRLIIFSVSSVHLESRNSIKLFQTQHSESSRGFGNINWNCGHLFILLQLINPDRVYYGNTNWFHRLRISQRFCLEQNMGRRQKHQTDKIYWV